jgi:hypothetical protein
VITADTTREEAAEIYTQVCKMPIFVLSPTKSPVANCDECSQKGHHDTPEEMDECPCLACHGFHAATTDLDRVLKMLDRYPDGLLAGRMGVVSGLVCIDFDPPAGLPTMRDLMERGILRETRAQFTGREGGIHMFFKHPGGYITSRAGGAGTGVDVKGDGGYVVLAPSVHPKTGRRYRWRYDWASAPCDELHPGLLDIIRPPEAPRRRSFDRTITPRGHTRMVGLVRTVMEAPPGQSNSALYWASCRAGELVARGEVTAHQAHAALFEAALQRGIPEREAGATPDNGVISQGLRRGQR